MDSINENPKITPFLRAFTLIEALVLVAAGFGLFLFPSIVRPQWPWQLAPFNTLFMGAFYLGAMAPVGIMFLSGRWSPTRPVLRAIFSFTFIVTVVSFFTSSQFDMMSWRVWIWFGLYASLAISAGYHLWQYRSLPTSHLNPVPSNWSTLLRSAGFLLVLYGLGLLFLPNIFNSSFPWTLDVFHSQMYSATYIAPGIMMFTVAKFATPAEFITVGLSEAVFSIFAIFGLFIVDAQVELVDWDSLITLSWLGALALLAALGIAMIVAGSRNIPHKMGDR